MPDVVEFSSLRPDEQALFVYIHDLLHRRGLHRTARELLREITIPTDCGAPINVKDGFLSEWWCVFWDLYATKIIRGRAGAGEVPVYTETPGTSIPHDQQLPGTAPENSMSTSTPDALSNLMEEWFTQEGMSDISFH